MINEKYLPEGWDNIVDECDSISIKEAYENGRILQGLVRNCDSDFNLHIKLGKDLEGIVPRNELEGINIDELGFCNPSICKNKVNSFIQFKVKELSNTNRIILSRKSVQNEVLAWIKEELEPGMVVKGIVKNIRKYGVFVEIGGGVVGLLHIEDISVSRIKSPNERFSVGQKIDVMIKSIDKINGKIILSYKELLGDWEDNIKEYEEKTVVEGTIKEPDKFKNGIFIELKPNLVGMAEYKEGFEYGQKVKVYIKKMCFYKDESLM